MMHSDNDNCPAPFMGQEPAGRIDGQDGIPAGFSFLPDGIYLEIAPSEPQWICSPPKVSALFCDGAARNWGRLVEVRDRDGNWHVFPVFDNILSKSAKSVLSDLEGLGLHVPRKKGRGELISTLIADWAPTRRLVTARRLGWTDQSMSNFVLGSGKVVGSIKVLPVDDALTSLADQICTRGSLDDWKNTVAQSCVGNPLLLLAVSLAFSGPLLELLDLDFGGGLHLRGTSSCGKSTILRAAASVWGSPQLMGSWRATANGLEGVAAARNSMLLVLDELAEISGKEFGATVYMLANGVGKERMGRFGSTKETLRWKLAILSSGEIGAAEKLSEAGRRQTAGQEVRLVDIEADMRAFGAFDDLHGATDGAIFADQLKAYSAGVYGSAGPAFVKLLIEKRDEIQSFSDRFLKTFEASAEKLLGAGAGGQDRRVLKRFALIAMAGELATRFGLTGWGRGVASNAAFSAFADWQDRRPTAGDAENLALEKTRSWLSAHANQLVHLTHPTAPVPPNPVGWRNFTHVFLPGGTWHEIHPANEAVAAAKQLKILGALLSGDGANMTRKAPREIRGRPRVYMLRLEHVLGEPANTQPSADDIGALKVGT